MTPISETLIDIGACRIYLTLNRSDAHYAICVAEMMRMLKLPVPIYQDGATALKALINIPEGPM
jgi:hypothetical protein